MKKLIRAIIAVAALGFSVAAYALDPVWNYSVQVSAQVQASPAQITLSWPQDTSSTPSSYVVYRKAVGATSWGTGTTLAGTTTTYKDTGIAVGTAYEYQIVKNAGTVTGYGYIQAGINVPLVENRGKLVLVVDNTHAGALVSELKRLEQDLVGDGWTVVRHDVSRTASPASVKDLIKGTYSADPANVKAVFLFGRIPVPYSGNIVPDGHADHQGAWPADAYYADMDGSWTDSSVNFTQTVNGNVATRERLTNKPGDGKFDQNTIPSPVELMIGRVDLSNLPGKTAWNSPASFASEVELLRNYLNKDHNFRNRVTNPQRRAVIGDYFGSRSGEAFAASGYRAAAALVGHDKVSNLNLIHNDKRGVWVPALSSSDYLFAYGCGAGSFNSIAGLGNSGNYNDGTTLEFVNNDVKGVFTLLFGSWLGDWDSEDNIMRAVLATKTNGLTAAWSGRPHWFMHPMGLGEPIGAAAKLTQNNKSGLYKTQRDNSPGGIHVALMGDPTLRLHVVAPVSGLTGSVSGSTATLRWSAPNDSIIGYHVYRGASTNGTFTRLTSSPITVTSFADSAAPSNATYMVRAIKLETVASGSYYNGSTGKFWTVGQTTTSPTTTEPAPTSPTSPSSDTTAPKVTITSPINGATLVGSVTLSVNATDNVGVAGVQYTINDTNFGPELTTAPFTTTWNTSTIKNAWYGVRAVVRDAAGNKTTSNVHNVKVANAVSGTGTVPTSGSTSDPVTSPTSPTSPTTSPSSDTTAPKVALSSPINGATISGTITLASTATDNVGIAGIQYTVNGVNYGPELTSAPFTITVNTAQVANGWYGFRAIARDAAGNKTTSNVHNVKIANAVSGKGSTFTAPTSGSTDSGSTGSTGGSTSPTAPATTPIGANDTVWFHDALPAGATGSGSGGDTWNWITSNPAPFTGSKSHQSAISAGTHEHAFNWASATMTVAAGDKLFAYIFLDPANPPSQVMISWKSDNWEHRAYWGENKINYGKDGTNSRRKVGELPPTGGWVRLEVPAKDVGLEGHTVTGMSFGLFGGRASWDATGKSRP
jgi:hypothetical protein